MSYIDTKIDVDCKTDGIDSSYKIQQVYDEIRKEFTQVYDRFNKKLVLAKPFLKEDIKSLISASNKMQTIIPSDNIELLYGKEMYRVNGAIFTFTMYGCFDVIKKVINKIDTVGKYPSATRMEIQIRSKDSNIADRVNEIVQKYS